MDDVVGDQKIVFNWKKDLHRYHPDSSWDMSGQNSCKFPTSGKYQNKLELTFELLGDNCQYNLQWITLDVQERMKVLLYMLNYKKEFLISKECDFTCICDDTDHKHMIGYEKFFCSSKIPAKTSKNTTITLGCRIIFGEESEHLTIEKMHYKTMQNQFKRLTENDTFSDFTIKLDKKEFKVHKAFLAARSSVFETMLNIEMSEKRTNQLEITDIDLKIFKLMIEFIYTNKVDVELDYDETEQLLAVADKYQLEDLKDLCTNFFKKKLSMENIADHLILAVKYKSKSLMAAIKKIIRRNVNPSDLLCDIMLDCF